MKSLHGKSLRLTFGMAACYLLASCGGTDVIRTFRVALASSAPLVQSLVAAGALNENAASAIVADFNDGVFCADDLQRAFKAAGTDRSKKAAAARQGLQCFRAIEQRHNFEKHPRVKQAADIADGILASLVAFYSDGAESGQTEAQLEEALKAQVKRLEAALKP